MTRFACIAAMLVLSVVCESVSAQPIARKVLVIGIDGVRADALAAANTPNIDALIANGAFSPRCLAEDITISGPCWSSILTAVHRQKHGVSDNSFIGANYEQYPHFFVRLEAACEIETASIVNWAPINLRILGDNTDTMLTDLSDAQVAAETATLLATSNPDVIFVHFDDVDGAGHGSGFSPTNPPYLSAIETTDGYVGTLVAAIDARVNSALEDWLIIVVSDHGGSGTTHGQSIPTHRETGLVVSGDSAAAGTTILPDPELIDVPATVLTFLGVPIDAAWDWDGEPVGLDLANSPSEPFDCQPPPPPTMGACCFNDGSCAELEEADCVEQRGTYNGDSSLCIDATCDDVQILLTEDFESLTLGPNADETTPGAAVWTPNPPVGWSIDRSGVPSGGVTEWRGWSFTDKDWWIAAAGDQQRSLFTLATGTIAVADPDEWDDAGHAAGTYNTVLRTPAIDVSAILPDSLRLLVDSSWLPEDDQAAELRVSFDGGADILIQRWESQAGPNFKPNAPNEFLDIALPNPPGAENAVISFAMLDAGNDWWWAIDDVEVIGTRACSCDTNGDGNVSVGDLLGYLEIWFGEGRPIADLLAYLACWFPTTFGQDCP